MDVSGIIFAAVDCDADAIEDWNRWYDLEHLPPNVAIDGIMSGRRYVAPPELHDLREPGEPTTGFADGLGTHITIYTLSGDPTDVIGEMTVERDRLEAAGRMFAPEKKAVRAGDAFVWNWGVADPVLAADERDVPHIGHTAVRVVLRRGDVEAVPDDVAAKAVAVEGVHAVLAHSAVFQQGLDLDLYLLSGDLVDVLPACRAAAPYGTRTEIALDAPFQVIDPLRYPWAERIRDSWLPEKVG